MARPGMELPTREDMERQSAPARSAATLPPHLATSQDVAAIARHYSALAMRTLAEIADDPDAGSSARVAAAQALLERGHGKAVATTVMANPDGSALFSGVEIVLVRPRSRDVIEHEPAERSTPERDA